MKTVNSVFFLGLVLGIILKANFVQASVVSLSKDFTNQESIALSKALSLIEDKSPSKFTTLAKKYNITLYPVSNNTGRATDVAERNSVAFTKNNEIFLSANLFKEAYFNSIRDKTRHPNLEILLAATIVHEISHVIDLKEPLSGEEKDQLYVCNSNNDSSFDCNQLRQKKGKFSNSQKFMNAAGWRLNGKTERLNFNNSSSPDTYEFSSPSEAFAVNMEYYFFDTQYACRKPLLNKVLSDLFENPSTACNSTTGLVSLSEKRSQQVIPAHQIQKVSFFLAAPGDEMMSRWGHAMLYLTICPPNKNPLKDDCSDSISSHLVVSPAAFTYRGISAMDGLNGKYDMNYFITPAFDVIRDYTTVDLRDLEMYDLNINQKDMINAVLDLVWNFKGKYYFLTNNCAHGVQRIIGAIQDLVVQDPNQINPMSLKENLAKQGVISSRPNRVFKKNEERVRIRNKVAAAANRTWIELAQTPLAERQKIYSALQQNQKISISEITVFEYLVLLRLNDLYVSQIAQLAADQASVSEEDLKLYAKINQSIIPVDTEYGVPALNAIETAVKSEAYVPQRKAYELKIKQLAATQLSAAELRLTETREFYKKLLAQAIGI